MAVTCKFASLGLLRDCTPFFQIFITFSSIALYVIILRIFIIWLLFTSVLLLLYTHYIRTSWELEHAFTAKLSHPFKY